MTTIQEQIAQAKAAGYDDAAITKHLGGLPEYSGKIKTALDAGYQPSDILGYLAPATTTATRQNVAAEPPKTPIGKKRSWLDVPVEAVTNVVPSAINLASGIYEAVTSPVQTAKGIVDIGAGALQNVLPQGVVDFVNQFDKNPDARNRAIAAADAVGGFYKDRYGSEEAFKKTMATDPVGFAADLSTLLTGGATATARVAPAASTALAAGAKFTNPMNAIVPVVTAPVKAGVRGVDYARKVFNPKANALLQNIEDKGPDIVNALKTQPKFVAGAKPTAGELAATTGSTLYPALEKDVMSRISSKALARENVSKEAIKNQLGMIAKSPDELDQLAIARTNATEPLYTAVKQAGDVVDPRNMAKIANYINDTITKNPGNTELVTEFSKIGKLLEGEGGRYRTDAGQVASILDGLKATIAKQDNKFIKGELAGVKAQLVDAVPGYAAADAKFAELSKPINKMQVAQYLEGKLIPALEGKANLKSEAFAAALKDAPSTIKRSTGAPRYKTLADLFSPDELQAIEGITKELQRKSKFEEAAAAGAKEGVSLPAAKVDKVNMLNRVWSVANLVMAKLQGRVTEKIAVELAVEMLDPAMAAKSIEKALAHQARMEKLGYFPKKIGGIAEDVFSSQPAVAAGQVSNALVTQQQPQRNQNALAR
jgi:hypothetical protein